MQEPDDWEDDIVSTAILCHKWDLYITDVRLLRKVNLLLQRLNFPLLRIDASNFNLILI